MKAITSSVEIPILWSIPLIKDFAETPEPSLYWIDNILASFPCS